MWVLNRFCFLHRVCLSRWQSNTAEGSVSYGCTQFSNVPHPHTQNERGRKCGVAMLLKSCGHRSLAKACTTLQDHFRIGHVSPIPKAYLKFNGIVCTTQNTSVQYAHPLEGMCRKLNSFFFGWGSIVLHWRKNTPPVSIDFASPFYTHTRLCLSVRAHVGVAPQNVRFWRYLPQALFHLAFDSFTLWVAGFGWSKRPFDVPHCTAWVRYFAQGTLRWGNYHCAMCTCLTYAHFQQSLCVENLLLEYAEQAFTCMHFLSQRQTSSCRSRRSRHCSSKGWA